MDSLVSVTGPSTLLPPDSSVPEKLVLYWLEHA